MPARLPESHWPPSCFSGMFSMPSTLKSSLCLRAFALAFPTAWNVLPSDSHMPMSYLHSGLHSNFISSAQPVLTTLLNTTAHHLLTLLATFFLLQHLSDMTLKSQLLLFIVHFPPPENKLREGEDCIIHRRILSTWKSAWNIRALSKHLLNEQMSE